jgi:hypothetical protein
MFSVFDAFRSDDAERFARNANPTAFNKPVGVYWVFQEGMKI